MSMHFTLSLYWLLVPLALGLGCWVLAARDDSPGGYLPDLRVFFRLPVAVIIFVLALCLLLAIQLWLR